jgi:hypothetical protein
MLDQHSRGQLDPNHLTGYLNSLEKLLKLKIEAERGLRARLPSGELIRVVSQLSQAIEKVLANHPDLKAALIHEIKTAVEQLNLGVERDTVEETP